MLGTLLFAFTGSMFTGNLRVMAEEHMDMMEMAMQAKTPAEHERLAALYDQETAQARAKADMHKKMAADIRKTGGALFSKVHYDEHCDALVRHYTQVATEYAALAKAERDMAKM